MGFFSCVLLGSFLANASAASAPLSGGGANIFIDFVNPGAGRVLIVGGFPSVPLLDLKDKTVHLDLSGFVRDYTLNASGAATGTTDLFELHDTGTGFVFILNALYDDLLVKFAPEGIANQNASNQPVTLHEAFTFNGATYESDIVGTYNATAGKNGQVYLGILKPPKNPSNPTTRFTLVRATPNPAQANQPVTIKATISLNDFTGPVTGHLYFGDFTPQVRATGADFESMLKKGVQHTYASEGVYKPRLILVGAQEVAETHIYVVVGNGYVVNSKSGARSKLTKTGGGGISLNIGVDEIPGATSAQTQFMDKTGTPIGRSRNSKGQEMPALQLGLSATNVFTAPGIYVAEVMALDNQNAKVGKVRKTITISAADIKSTMAADVSPRDSTTGDAAITLSSMSGKFQFTSSKMDKITFNGSFTLPAGYTPSNPSGNDIQVSLGTVIDTVHLDSKGKLTLPTELSRITAYKLTLPKLTNGVAAGTETAKVSMTMDTANLDLLGFDSEGVTATVRSDESGQSSVARFIQIDMLMAGTTYSALSQVNYAVTSNADFGTISGRASK